jgi:tRNA A-37 threonylcarbamoyl transferase component Bud32
VTWKNYDAKNKMNDELYYIKDGVDSKEYNIHDIIYRASIVNCPKIYRYDAENKKLVMRHIPNYSVSDTYGENFEDVPANIIEKIRDTVADLYFYGIEYPDITGYNFIEYQNKIWIIDFEHASLNPNRETYDPFILKFIQGHNDWNPEYK